MKEFFSNTGAVTFNVQAIKSTEILSDVMDSVAMTTQNAGETLAMVAKETTKSNQNESLQMGHLTGDIPWMVSYIKDHPEQALLCLLFSLAIGICCILVAILFCVCCRWRQTKRRGEFKVTKISSSASAVGNREADNLLGPSGVYTNTSSGRVYSSPRLIRAEYARGISTSSGGGNTPSSTLNQPSNPNFVGLYISQPPKSRWSRTSDAVWPVPPTSLPTAATIATGNLRHPTGAATLPSHQRFLDEPDTGGNNRQTITSNSPFLPSLATLLAEDRQSLLQKPPGNDLGPYSVQSAFAPTNSSTDFLFNRQSTPLNPDNRQTLQQHPSIKTTPTHFSPVNSYRDTSGINNICIDPSLLRNPPLQSSTPQKKTFSQPYPASYSGSPYHHQHHQHHSFMAPGHLLSPPILPAPATSSWPTRNSQILVDEDD